MIVRCNSLLVAFATFTLAAAGCGQDAPAPAPEGENEKPSAPRSGEQAAAVADRVEVPHNPTFYPHIARIVFDNCSVCHRPGESGPFSLLTYDDVRKRAEQIVEVTQSRFMPPWLPEPGYGEFADPRVLAPWQIETIQKWVVAGAPEGDPAQGPADPEFTEGWQLGEPDLIVRMPEPFTLPAEGISVFRNFVMRVSNSETHYVKALEVRPGSPKVVHHGILQIDDTGASRRLDQEEPEPGFPGMEMPSSRRPEGQIDGWLPGRQPYAGRDDISWRLNPGTDLVLQLHMIPSGKPERIQPAVGLFFARQPPRKHPLMIQLTTRVIDIPPGREDYLVKQTFELPADVDVLGVQPHAHYLCQEMKGYATLPGGDKRWLIHIKQWDFDWQDGYRYKTPLFLPEGSVLTIEYMYDNSANNPRNPHAPPRRVSGGWESDDEMAELWVQVLPRNPEDRPLILEEIARYRLGLSIEHYQHELESDSKNVESHKELGILFFAAGDFPSALTHLRRAIQLRPDLAAGHFYIGSVLAKQGSWADAVTSFLRDIELRPEHAEGHYNLALAYEKQGKGESAQRHYKLALRHDPKLVSAHANLARLLAKEKKWDQAEFHFQAVLPHRAGDSALHCNLGLALANQAKWQQAAEHFEEALRIRPDLKIAQEYLQRVRQRLDPPPDG